MTPTETHKLFHDLSVKASEYVTNRNSVPKVPVISHRQKLSAS